MKSRESIPRSSSFNALLREHLPWSSRTLVENDPLSSRTLHLVALIPALTLRGSFQAASILSSFAIARPPSPKLEEPSPASTPRGALEREAPSSASRYYIMTATA